MKKWMLYMLAITPVFAVFATINSVVAYPIVRLTGMKPYLETSVGFGSALGLILTFAFCCKFYDDCTYDELNDPIFKPRKERCPDDELLRPR